MLLNKLKILGVTAIIMAMISPALTLAKDPDSQKAIKLDGLDLNLDGYISRREVGEYMFFYFDSNGDERLNRGEYRKGIKVNLPLYEGNVITYIDIDNDGVDDGTDITTVIFLQKAMIGSYNEELSIVKPREFLGTGFVKTDTDKNKHIELNEWRKMYGARASRKKLLK